MVNTVDCEKDSYEYNVGMKKGEIPEAKLKADKDIGILYRDLEKTLPKFSDFFIMVVLNDFGENVNLKKLYPDLYKRMQKVVDDLKKNAAKNPQNPKTKETKRLHWIYQYYLKTDMKYKPKAKN